MVCFLLLIVLISVDITLSAQPCCNQIVSDGSGFATLKNPNFPKSDGMSVSLWMTPNTDDMVDVLEYVDPSGASLIYLSTKQVLFLSHVIANITLSRSKTSHVTLTWLSESGARFYQDGKLVVNDTSATGMDLNFNGTWQVGKQLSDTYESEGGLDGSTCGVTIWSRDLTDNDVIRIFSVESGTETETEVETSESEAPLVTWEDFEQTDTTLDSSSCTGAIKLAGSGIRLGNLDAVSSKFVILFLVIIGVVIGFAGLFLCSEREIAVKRANINKRLQKESEHFSIDNGSTHSIT